MTSSKEISVQRRTEIDTQIREIENELIVYRSRISEVENELNAKRGEISQKTDQIHDLFKELYRGEITPFFSPESHYRARAEFKIWHVGDDIRYAMNPLERGGKMVLIEECQMVIEPIEKLA